MAHNVIRDRVRIPPQSLDAEMALLGSIMLRPDAMYEIMDVVASRSFYAEKHAIIFETMLELFSKHGPIDLLTLSSRLKEKNSLDQIGGSTFLTELVSMVPSSSNVKFYAEMVQKKHMMRRLIEASEYISSIGFEEGQDLEEALDKAEKKIYEVTNLSGAHTFTHLKDELVEAWERLDRLHNSCLLYTSPSPRD